MVGVKLKLDSEHHCPTEGGVISFFRGEVLSGVLNCRAWSADPDPSDRYNLEWQVAFDFECSKGRFRYSGFLPNLTPAALDPEKVVFHGPERDFQADFGPGEALDDGRDYRYIVRSDGRAVFVKNKYMPYRVSLAVRDQDLGVKYEFLSGGKDDRPEQYFPDLDVSFIVPETPEFLALIYFLPLEPMLFRRGPLFFDEEGEPISGDGDVEVDDYDLEGQDFVDLCPL